MDLALYLCDPCPLSVLFKASMKATTGNHYITVVYMALAFTSLVKTSVTGLDFILYSLRWTTSTSRRPQRRQQGFPQAVRGQTRRSDCCRNFVALFDVSSPLFGVVFRRNFRRLLGKRFCRFFLVQGSAFTQVACTLKLGFPEVIVKFILSFYTTTTNLLIPVLLHP